MQRLFTRRWMMIRPRYVPRYVPRYQLRRLTNVPGNPLEDLMGEADEKPKSKGTEALRKGVETMAVMLGSLLVLGLAGLAYHRGYKIHSLNKVEAAFYGDDPTFQLRMYKRDQARSAVREGWVLREHQQLLDDVVSGKISGRYYLVIGEKGTGKTSMIMEALKKVDGRHCAYFDAHSDPEIFRIRLGRALNFEYHEDYLGSLFSIRGPRDAGALLDIERAFNTLETVAVDHRKKYNRPLVLIINSCHLIGSDEQGNSMVELLQQKAEALAGSGLVTMIFNSDDYWLSERLKKLGTKMDVLTIGDFSRKEAVTALKTIRYLNTGVRMSDEQANEVYNLIGGRPQHIGAVADDPDIIRSCHRLIDKEKTWFLNQCGLLGQDMDDDVMESGKFSTSAMFLMKALVQMERIRHESLSADELSQQNHYIPKIPLWRARQIMTRPDYIQHYDNLNIFTIDSNSMVKADSFPMLQAFREIVSMPGFDNLLEETADRVSAIESLGRTREVVAKDLIEKGSYSLGKDNDENVVVKYHPPENDDGKENELTSIYQLDKDQQSDWWNNRADKFQSRTKVS